MHMHMHMHMHTLNKIVYLSHVSQDFQWLLENSYVHTLIRIYTNVAMVYMHMTV